MPVVKPIVQDPMKLEQVTAEIGDIGKRAPS